VAVAIVASAFLVAGAARDVGRKNDVIEVTGSARRAIVADLGIWKGTKCRGTAIACGPGSRRAVCLTA
jgi:hypothetical protein